MPLSPALSSRRPQPSRRQPGRPGDAGKARFRRRCPGSRRFLSRRRCRFRPIRSLRDFLREERQGPEAAPAPGWASARSLSGKPPLSLPETLSGKSFFPAFPPLPPLPPGTRGGGKRLQAIPFHHAGETGKGHVDDPQHAVPRGPVEDSPEKTRRIPNGEVHAQGAVVATSGQYHGQEVGHAAEPVPAFRGTAVVPGGEMIREITEDHEEAGLVPFEVFEVEPDQAGKRFRPGLSVPGQVFRPRQVLLDHLVEDGEEDPVLAPEVMVERPFGDPRLLGDLRGGGVAVPFFREQVGSNRQDGGSPVLLPQVPPYRVSTQSVPTSWIGVPAYVKARVLPPGCLGSKTGIPWGGSRCPIANLRKDEPYSVGQGRNDEEPYALERGISGVADDPASVCNGFGRRGRRRWGEAGPEFREGDVRGRLFLVHGVPTAAVLG